MARKMPSRGVYGRERGYGKQYPDLSSWVALALIVLILVGTAWLLYGGCMEADARARSQWNCPVSGLIPVREPQKPYWTPDWGVTWLDVEVNDE